MRSTALALAPRGKQVGQILARPPLWSEAHWGPLASSPDTRAHGCTGQHTPAHASWSCLLLRNCACSCFIKMGRNLALSVSG